MNNYVKRFSSMEVELEQLRTNMQTLHNEVSRLTDMNSGLQEQLYNIQLYKSKLEIEVRRLQTTQVDRVYNNVIVQHNTM
jgi:hypothetical protein